MTVWLLIAGMHDPVASQQNAGNDDPAIRGDIYEASNAADLDWSGQPEWLEERLEWFEDLKFGILFSWGPCVVWGGPQSWCISPDAPWARPEDWQPWIDRNKDLEVLTRDYFQLYRQFNPVRFDPDRWAELAAYAGVKYIGLTTKHHDGFCLFDTKTTDFRITSPESPFSGDPRVNLTREVFDAFRKKDFGILCYFSKPDWYSPYYWSPDFPVTDRNVNYDTREYPDIWEKFTDYTFDQIKELMTDYGEIDILWLDGGQVRPPLQDIGMLRIGDMARSHQEKLIVVDRTVGGRYENIITPEQYVPSEPLEKTWETCATIQRSGWTWRPDVPYRSSRELLYMLIDIVSKGGNLLLGIGPDPNGELDPKTTERLHDLGDWMQINSESIHNTRAWTNFSEGDRIRFTRTKDWKYVYIHLLDWPGNELCLKTIRPVDGTELHLLGHDQPLKWRVEDEAVVVDLPESLQEEAHRPCRHAWVIKTEARQPVLKPVFQPHGAIFGEGGMEVTISTETRDAEIHYSMDGNEPDRNARLYRAPLRVQNSVVLKAVSWKDGLGYSPVETGFFMKKAEPYKGITLVTPPSPKYPGKGTAGLNDGILPGEDFDKGWLGYEESDMEVIIDLGEIRTINLIASCYLQYQEMWIFLPESVEFALSGDGKEFRPAGVESLTVSPDSRIQSTYFVQRLDNNKARYVKVKANNVGTCPSWHKGAGGKAWLFADEIIVE